MDSINADVDVDAEPAANKRVRNRIGDVGERFGGARKDLATKGDLDLQDQQRSDPPPQLALKALWPRPSFRDLAIAGDVQVSYALMYAAIYDSIRSSPVRASYRLYDDDFFDRQYTRGIAFLRQAFEQRRYPTLDELTTAYRAHMGANQPDEKSTTVASCALGRNGRKKGSIRHPLALTTELKTRIACLADLGWPQDPRVKDNDRFGVDYFEYDRPDTHHTGWRAVRTKSDTAHFLNEDPLPDRASALVVARQAFEAFLIEREASDADTAKTGKKKRPAAIPRRPELNRPAERVGPDWRSGSHVTPDQFMAEFGWRGVEIGLWVSQSEAQGFLDTAFDALCDLCELLHQPRTFASLFGRLGIAYGSRGRGFIGGAAHFDSARHLVHITKAQGVGALAHEFGHALDQHLFGRNVPSTAAVSTDHYLSAAYFTEKRIRGVIPVLAHDAAIAPHMQSLSLAIMGTDGRRSQFLAAAYELDGDRRNPYWRRHTELFARVFETWASDELDRLGRKNEFLVYGCAQDAPPDDWKLGHEPYPRGHERTRIVHSVRAFVKAVSTSLHPPSEPGSSSDEGTPPTVPIVRNAPPAAPAPQAKATSSVAAPAVPAISSTSSSTQTATPTGSPAPTCPACGAAMRIRTSHRGPFYGCTSFPTCKGTRPAPPLPATAAPKPTCLKCGSPLKRKTLAAKDDVKRGRGYDFFSCTAFPRCTVTYRVTAEGTPLYPAASAATDEVQS